jgi:hypothetical protein
MSRIQQFDFTVDILQALLWQYNEALRLQGLLENQEAWCDINQTEFWESWITDVFDLRTANDFGLIVWSIILGIPLSVEEPPSPPKPTWGFGQYYKNFNNGNFRQQYSGYINLTTEQKRIVLRLRYFQLVTNGTVPQINQFFSYLFGPGEAYVLDTYDMSMAYYIFTSELSSQLQFVLQKYDLLPRPAGVGVGYAIIPKDTFGFEEFHLNFDNGNFLS